MSPGYVDRKDREHYQELAEEKEEEAQRLLDEGKTGEGINSLRSSLVYWDMVINKSRKEKADIAEAHVHEIKENIDKLQNGGSESSQESRKEEKEDTENMDIREVNWDDIGGLDDEIESIKNRVVKPIEKKDIYWDLYKIKPPRGILLFGPPGTGKTMIALAMANELGYNVIAKDASEFKKSLVGESEKQVREIFQECREKAPTLLLIDEISGLLPSRTDNIEVHEESLVNAFLTNMEGLKKMEDVIVVGTTNFIDKMDSATRRRFDFKMYISPPSQDGRKEIFSNKLGSDKENVRPLDNDVNIERLAEKTEHYTGSEIEEICDAAAELAADRTKTKEDPSPISIKDFNKAIDNIQPTLTPKKMKIYNRQKRFESYLKYGSSEDKGPGSPSTSSASAKKEEEPEDEEEKTEGLEDDEKESQEGSSANGKEKSGPDILEPTFKL